MNAEEFVNNVLTPGAVWCTGLSGWKAPFDAPALVLLTAISGQEANWTARVQARNGPAHGLFQFERRGGVAGVLDDDTTCAMANAACNKIAVSIDSLSVWNALTSNDALAVAFARLLLWSDEAPLPALNNEEGAWNYYIRNWRPGAPDRVRWHVNYQSAMLWAIPQSPSGGGTSSSINTGGKTVVIPSPGTSSSMLPADARGPGLVNMGLLPSAASFTAQSLPGADSDIGSYRTRPRS